MDDGLLSTIWIDVTIYNGGGSIQAGIAQLGEQQTEACLVRFLEVPCSIHGPGIRFSPFYRAHDPPEQ
ncbi:hypothetical protein SCLCIDRAFT_511937 [Scleroderma citrinum Foug A]|uniref:Uncharacterized protein n=1 Tax=Scleroderma citrinum Foug A TaxID=1036808 RepID=A0A0C3EPW0_9AGAM|nr:hypothetical protein SCLCIDRAFT_511937 [Scleroderma citrinum Foug A]